ncbi:uncharacterized protein PHACADRAFT_167863 [Phanerochaete carnosa HHB-10118-sp]|uniref:DNA mismatch repair proteins mutS family domain-containing protein n=1 Tax=Phanerochaete carnosa (strain HHB-10118-sp) TaxID=650164 RepID=K5WM57_PHACS|nr:uncharacterized protein PHACADRAFT_167863 [Phanerochaete carnosa HHB-10118-sp]EKM60520.1 hypothetical protein PHACADRAFT_167863 [Phanerochaete carnosa HHB-10118-sp]
MPSGKSTYLHQICRLTIMAMSGRFVHAEYFSNDDELEKILSTFALCKTSYNDFHSTDGRARARNVARRGTGICMPSRCT